MSRACYFECGLAGGRGGDPESVGDGVGGGQGYSESEEHLGVFVEDGKKHWENAYGTYKVTRLLFFLFYCTRLGDNYWCFRVTTPATLKVQNL